MRRRRSSTLRLTRGVTEARGGSGRQGIDPAQPSEAAEIGVSRMQLGLMLYRGQMGVSGEIARGTWRFEEAEQDLRVPCSRIEQRDVRLPCQSRSSPNRGLPTASSLPGI